MGGGVRESSLSSLPPSLSPFLSLLFSPFSVFVPLCMCFPYASLISLYFYLDLCGVLIPFSSPSCVSLPFLSLLSLSLSLRV